MKQKLLDNLKTDTSGKWASVDDVEQLVNQVIAEAISAVEQTGRQCAYTTHDLSIVDCTISRSATALKNHFGVK